MARRIDDSYFFYVPREKGRWVVTVRLVAIAIPLFFAALCVAVKEELSD
jgi:hypothetical protein